MKFQKMAEKIYVAENITVNCTCLNGTQTTAKVHFRIDGRDLKSGYRVDVMEPVIPVWEAIDGMKPAKNLKEAKAMCQKWLENGMEVF